MNNNNGTDAQSLSRTKGWEENLELKIRSKKVDDYVLREQIYTKFVNFKMVHFIIAMLITSITFSNRISRLNSTYGLMVMGGD